MERSDNEELGRCNCRLKEECHVNEARLARDAVSEAKAISSGESKYYVGAAEGEWKSQYCYQ